MGWIRFVAAVGLAWPAFAQIDLGGASTSRYELQYGTPIDVSIADLVEHPESYENRSVRTHGKLDLQGLGSYAIRDSFAAVVRIAPVSEIAGAFDDEARRLLGLDMEVTGVFVRTSTPGTGPNVAGGAIRFWSFVGGEPDKAPIDKATDVSLESLVTRPGTQDGRWVRVVGQFRGRNLFGDLPSHSQTGRGDWVLKDELFAVWISGKKPKGDGFELDASLRRDTGKWLEVTGRVETLRGFTYIRAQSVRLTTEPRAQAQVQPPPSPPERPKRPPVVVFTLPLDGDQAVSGDTRFAVQFSNDMEEGSFAGKVVLRYSGQPQPGDREFDALKVSYDGGRRALVVEPGDRLRPGRQVELLLLAGIVDTDGRSLEPRTVEAANPGEVVDRLRFRVAF